MAWLHKRTTDPCVLEVWAGPISIDEWIAHERGQLRDPKFRGIKRSLWDIRSADCSALDLQTIGYGLKTAYADAADLIVDNRVAILARQGFSDNSGLIATARNFGITAITFHERFGPACAWLGIDRANAQQWCDAATQRLITHTSAPVNAASTGAQPSQVPETQTSATLSD